ncbi:ABC transporter permease subunit [candidate division KSB1 bacterium]|nr:MAG: ABC transporter permease subunit [candidate division KSB1 bacterium]
MLKKLILFIVLLAVTVGTIYPVLTVITVSLRPGDRLLSTSLAIIPDGATFENYIALFRDKPFARWMFNSTLVALAVTIFATALASTAGYAFSRFRFPGHRAGMTLLLVTQMFPATMLLLPLFLMLAKLQLINSYLGLIAVYSATALPFTIWQMKGYYDTIPRELEEAALMDGAGYWRVFYSIILPLAAPALVITALFSFLTAWSEYIVAAQVLLTENLFTLPLGLKQFQSSMTTEWGLYSAGSIIVSIPVIALFLYLSKWLVSGLTLGSVKG